MSKFIFVRHGESEGNAQGYIATPETKLTEKGITQARQTAAEVKQFHITKIACSPMIRAQQTAEAIAAELGIDVGHIEIIPELEERRFGEGEGKPKEHPSEWYYLTEEEPTAEKPEILLARMKNCVLKLKKIAEHDNLLVVGHACSGFYMLQAVKGNTKITEFDSPKQMSNADFIEVKI